MAFLLPAAGSGGLLGSGVLPLGRARQLAFPPGPMKKRTE
jgi:hypothetical protein